MYFLSNQWSGKNFNCMVLKLLENAFASQNIESRHFHQWFPPYKTSILIVLPITMLIQFFTSLTLQVIISRTTAILKKNSIRGKICCQKFISNVSFSTYGDTFFSEIDNKIFNWVEIICPGIY